MGCVCVSVGEGEGDPQVNGHATTLFHDSFLFFMEWSVDASLLYVATTYSVGMATVCLTVSNS